MGDIIQYFLYPLIGGVLLAILSSLFGSFVVLRKEANISHALAHMVFLGASISLVFGYSYYLLGSIFGLIGGLLIYFLEKKSSSTSDAVREITAQIGLSAALVILSLLPSMQSDIHSVLFGNFLFINKTDVIYLTFFSIISFILYYFYSDRFRAISLLPDEVRVKNSHAWMLEIGYNIILSIFIALSLKMVGVLLIAAFLVLPVNISKNIAHSQSSMLVFAGLISISSVIIGFLVSYHFDISTSGTIVLIMSVFYLISMLLKNIRV